MATPAAKGTHPKCLVKYLIRHNSVIAIGKLKLIIDS